MDENEEVIEKVKKLFEGKDIFLDDGRLGRHKIGLIVFADPEKWKLWKTFFTRLWKKK